MIRPTCPHWPKSRFGRRLSIFVIERQGLRASAISMTRLAYAKSRAGFERIEGDVFSEEVSAQASGRDFKAFVLYPAQGFGGEEADLTIGIASRVAVAAYPMTGDQFGGFDRSFAFALL